MFEALNSSLFERPRRHAASLVASKCRLSMVSFEEDFGFDAGILCFVGIYIDSIEIFLIAFFRDT